MELGLRIVAFVIDVALCFSTLMMSVCVVNLPLEMLGQWSFFLLPVMFVLLCTWPFAYFGIPTGLWGRTPGRWICRLTVVDSLGERPGLWRGVGREALKLLAWSTGIGGLITGILLLNTGVAWYDQLCGTQVEFRPYVKLTPTQKNWRKFMKKQEQERRKKNG